MLKGNLIKKYDHFEDLLIEIFNIERSILLREFLKECIKLEVDYKDLSKSLQNQWSNLLEKCEVFNDIQEEFLERFVPWREKFDAFTTISKSSEMKEFLEKYFSTWMRLSFETKDITRDEIKQIINSEKPRISSLFKGYYGRFANFLIFKNEFFNISLHLKLNRFKTGTYSLLVIISVWFDNPNNLWDSNVKLNLRNYKNSVIAVKLFKKFKVLGYDEDPLFYQEKSSTHNRFIVNPYSLIENKPHPSNCLILEILNENPLKLFEELKSHLYQIDEIIDEIIYDKTFSVQKWYENLSIEIKNFMNKGKELFSLINELSETPQEKTEGKESKVKRKKQEETQFLEKILGFFKDALNLDNSDNSKAVKDKGFRTKNQIYKEYKTHINVSQPTFYAYFEKLNWDLYLESRPKSDKGGGMEYRYKEINIITPSLIKKDIKEIELLEEDDSFISEKMTIQQALHYYNNKSYEKSIELLSNMVRKPSKRLIENSVLYFTCLYYLGRSYYKMENYQSALQNFEKIYSFDKSIYNVNYYIVECYRFLRKYNEAIEKVDEFIDGIHDLFKKYKITFNLHYLFTNWLEIEDLKELNLDISENEDFSRFLIFLNKSTDNFQIRTWSNSRSEISREFIEQWEKNIIALRILYKIQIKLFFIKVEISRRLIFQSILTRNEIIRRKTLGDLINFLKYIKKDSYFQKNFLEDLDNFLFYFKNISKAFDVPLIEEKINEEFPNLENSYTIPRISFLLLFEPIYNFINRMNRIYFEIFEDKDFILNDCDINKNQPISPFSQMPINEPELKAEYYFSQAYLNYKYSIDKRVDKEKELLNKLDLDKINDVKKIIKGTEEYHSPYPSHLHPKNYLKMIQVAHKFCNENNLMEYLSLIDEMYSIIKEKFKIINDLMTKRHNLTLNRKFELLSKDFQVKEKIFELNFEQKPKIKSLRYFIEWELRRKIESILEGKRGKIIIKLILFNQNIIQDVVEGLKRVRFFRGSVEGHFRAIFKVNFNFEINNEKKAIILKLNHIKTFSGMDFGEKLDGLTRVIFNAIYLNIDYFFIEFDPEEELKFKNYFETQFPEEYRNDHFSFEVEEKMEDNIIKIIIKKK